MLENIHIHGLTEIEMAFLGGAFFVAGSSTVGFCLLPPEYVAEIRGKTSAAISTVLMAAACFPEEQAQVQVELDAVIGRHRGSLIFYCSALIQSYLHKSANLRRPRVSSSPSSIHL
jgi:hypothetical protein